ncbi:hypothetical protein [Halapricum sp. CBA1109]|uniref:hypothetical protein n=1 Tax=Halapricum sp. CBA1109 TaxID=2668068 RepID=UPI00351AE095
MSDEYTREDIPLYEQRSVRDDQYRAAESEGQPYLAIERYEDGYTITYDLLPAGVELAPPAHSELGERVTHAVEEIVGDDSRATAEISQSISASLGSIGVFDRERSARDVAVVVGRLVLDEDNWTDAPDPEPPGDSLRKN